MARPLIPVLYRAIRPDAPQTLAQLCRRAHALGFELVPFNGYDPVERPTPEQVAGRRVNEERLLDILGDDHYHAITETFELYADLPTLEDRLEAAGYPRVTPDADEWDGD